MMPFFEEFFDRISEMFRDIEHAITGLPVEGLDWSPAPDMNSFNVLVVHTTGAARYWVGDVAGSDPSERNRAAEFEVSGLDEAALKQRLAETLSYIKGVLETLSLDDLKIERISPKNERTFTVGWALLHALEHTAIHVGHMQIMRQLWEQRQ